MSEDKKKALIAFAALTIFGMVFFLFGAFMLNSYGDKKSCTEPVDARVVRLVEHKSSSTGRHKRRSVTYAPVFKYEYNGTEYTYESTVGTYPAEFSSGEHVTVWVNPSDPKKIYYEPGSGSVTLCLIFRIVGGGIAVGGLIAFVVRLVKKDSGIPKLKMGD